MPQELETLAKIAVDCGFRLHKDLPLGLLMNFGQGTFKAGLQRIANNYFGRIG